MDDRYDKWSTKLIQTNTVKKQTSTHPQTEEFARRRVAISEEVAHYRSRSESPRGKRRTITDDGIGLGLVDHQRSTVARVKERQL
jgi:hypothetical protein